MVQVFRKEVQMGVNNDKYNDTYQALNLWAEYKENYQAALFRCHGRI